MSLTHALRKRTTRSLQAYATDPTNDGRIVKQFLDCLDTDVSRTVSNLFTEGKHKELLEVDINPLDYADNQGDLFHRDYIAVNFLSKNESLKTGLDTRERAFAKFKLMEQQCKETNIRFRSDSELEHSEFALLLFAMRRKIDLVLGEFDIEEFFDKSSWGPGSTTLTSGPDVSGARKYQSENGITRSAYSLMGSSLASAYPGWFREEHVSDSSVAFQDGNKVITVPKNSKTDRVIAVEPGLNLYFQKGVGAMIKGRLKGWGIDLTDQSRNQALAKIGSLTGHLATIDFSSASDSIAKRVVRHLLPVRWYTVMELLRCKSGSLDNELFDWEKFSSMGNGFTFELESLIFWAAAIAVCEESSTCNHEVSVFGDDVILPSSVCPRFEELCTFLGFTVNRDKSFSSGPFRESCGAHFFKGLDVKPIYHKKELSDAFSVYKLANSVRRLAHRRNLGSGCELRFLGTWRRILQGLPGDLRSLRVPEGYGDGGVASNFDEATPERLQNGYEGYRTYGAVQRSARIEHSFLGLLQQRLRQVGAGTLYGAPRVHRRARIDGPGDEFFVTRVLTRLQQHELGLSTQRYGNESDLRGCIVIGVSPIAVPSWYDFGEWC